MLYPEECIKGIPNKSFLVDGEPGTHLFYFKEEHARDDGWIEESINWNDDDNAIPFTLSQRKPDGKLQFSAGVVLVPRSSIDTLNSLPTVNGVLGYERAKLDDNEYHGNILLQSTVSKAAMKKIAAGIALHISKIIFPDTIDDIGS